MSVKRFVLLLSCVSVFTWIVAKADAPSIHLVRQGDTRQIDPIDDQLGRMMKWRHGAYLVMDTVGGKPPVFYTLDRDGTWTDTVQFRNPEPTRLYVSKYDRESDGTIVFSGRP